MTQTKKAAFANLDELVAQVSGATKRAEDGTDSNAPGAKVENNEVDLTTGELGKEVESELKSRPLAVVAEPDATVGKNKEQQLMIGGGESHQVDGIDLPIATEAKDPGTSTPVRVGGEKYAKMTATQVFGEASKLAAELLKDIKKDPTSTTPGHDASPADKRTPAQKVEAANNAGKQAADVLLSQKRAMVAAEIERANFDADLVIGFLSGIKQAEEEEEEETPPPEEEGGAGAEAGGMPPSDGGGAPPEGGGAGGGDPLAALMGGGGGAPPPMDPAAGGGGMPPGGGDMGGMPPGAGGGMPPGAGGSPDEAQLIQQLLQLLAQPQLQQMAAGGGQGAKIASVVQKHLQKSATPATRKQQAIMQNQLRSYLGEVTG